MAKKKGKKKGNTVTVDMTGVETSTTAEVGHNILTVDSVEEKDGEEYSYLSWCFTASTGGKVYENTSLSPQSLWKLRGVLEALGLEVEEEEMELELDEYVGLEMGAELEHEKYNGKKKPIIVDMYPAEENEPEEEEEEEEEEEVPKKKGKKGKKSKKEEATITKGSTVSFDDDDEEHEGEVIKINKKKGIYTVETDDAEWELELDDLTLVDD